MAKQTKPYLRLNLKLLIMLLASALAALAVAFSIYLMGNYFVKTTYCAPARQTARIQCIVSSFRDYVAKESVSSLDVEKIGLWNREQPYARLIVSGNGAILNSDRWGADLVRADNGLVLRADTSGSSSMTFPVNFKDGAYQVQVLDSSESRLYMAVKWGAATAACLLFLAIMLLYNSHVTSAVTRLARQVRQVSKGDLSLEITPTSRDEIGELAEDVDAMRLSIIDKLQREEEAWQANTCLITAMSHDVRTPLTSLLGYLDLLTDSGNLPPEQQREYLEVCRRKAEKLRELTGELFSYFLVFGKPKPNMDLEDFDAQTLLDQLLGEHTAELISQGYQVQFLGLDSPGQIRVDVQHLRRVFDNLFSNVRKYADPAKPVTVTAVWVAGTLHISITNALSHNAGQVESTKIGLQTCEKLLTSMGGDFQRHQSATSFTAEVHLPQQ